MVNIDFNLPQSRKDSDKRPNHDLYKLYRKTLTVNSEEFSFQENFIKFHSSKKIH